MIVGTGFGPFKESDAQAAIALFVIWTFGRICHSICYLLSLVPWRSIAFSLSILSTFVMVIYGIVRAFEYKKP